MLRRTSPSLGLWWLDKHDVCWTKKLSSSSSGAAVRPAVRFDSSEQKRFTFGENAEWKIIFLMVWEDLASWVNGKLLTGVIQKRKSTFLSRPANIPSDVLGTVNSSKITCASEVNNKKKMNNWSGVTRSGWLPVQHGEWETGGVPHRS